MEAIIHRARKGEAEVPAQMRLRHPGRAKVQKDLFQAFCKLAHLRAATPALRQRARVDLSVDDESYAFARVSAGSGVIVVFNHAEAAAGLRILSEGSGIEKGIRLEKLLATTPEAGGAPRRLDIECRPTPPRSIGERPQVTEPAV